MVDIRHRCGRPEGGRELWVFGHLVATPGVPAGIWIMCGVSATAALAMVAAVAYVRGRRLERRMAAELDEARAEMARRSAGDAARTTLLSWRVAELQTLVDRLIAERGDGLVVVRDAAEGVGAREYGSSSPPSVDTEVGAWHARNPILSSRRPRPRSVQNRAHI